MTSKLEKLKELGELLKSKAITQSEFEQLKKEVLSPNPSSDTNPKLIELEELRKTGAITNKEFYIRKKGLAKPKINIAKKSSTTTDENTDPNKERIILESFTDSNNKTINAPEIHYLNFKNISNSERRRLKSFLRLKEINGFEMTNDEFRLSEKLFTYSEFTQMNSEKSGFNYPFASISSLIALGLAIYFLTHGVGAIILGAGSVLIFSLINAILTLSKPDATRLDRNCSMISLVGVIISFFIVYQIIFNN